MMEHICTQQPTEIQSLGSESRLVVKALFFFTAGPETITVCRGARGPTQDAIEGRTGLNMKGKGPDKATPLKCLIGLIKEIWRLGYPI